MEKEDFCMTEKEALEVSPFSKEYCEAVLREHDSLLRGHDLGNMPLSEMDYYLGEAMDIVEKREDL